MSPINHSYTAPPSTDPTGAPITTTIWNADHSAPTLAEVLVAGAEAGDAEIGFTAALIEGSTQVNIRGRNTSGAGIATPASFYAGSSTGTGVGGTVNILGGDGGTAANGGLAYVAGGYGDGATTNPAEVRANGGRSTGAGGAFAVNGGNATGGSNAAGGDITLTPGAKDGAGRNGLVFLNLPTSDPGIAGALWQDVDTVKVSL